MALTERAIRDAKPGPRTAFLRDTEVRGFAVRVTPAGARAFVLKYRVDGRQRLATIGRPGEMSLRDARQRAGDMLAEARAGRDPLGERQARREAPTVADGLDRFFSEFVPRRIADGRMAAGTVREYRKQARFTVRPALGPMKIEAVTRADVERAVAKCAPVQRNRTIAFASRLFNVFEDWEWRAQQTNPARRIEKTREEPRDRVLAPSEVQALGATLANMADPFAAAALRFLTLTGWRTGEALALRWEHVNFETGSLTLPATKTGRDTRVVGAYALEGLAELPGINRNPFVFAGQGLKALTYGTLRKRFLEACAQAGIADARLHDIRRSVATSAAADGVSPFMLRDLLNHKTVAMANRYARRAGAALQDAQDASAARMGAMLDGEGADIVPLLKRDAG